MTNAATTQASLTAEKLLAEDETLGLLVRAVMSQWLAGGKRAWSPGRLSRLVAMYGRTDVRIAGTLYPAPTPELGLRDEYPSGYVQLRDRHGMSVEDLVGPKWRKLRRQEAVTAAFEDELLECFFPPELWPVFAALIVDGPAVAGERCELLLDERVEAGVEPCRRREVDVELLAQSTIDAEAALLLALIAVIKDVRARGFPAPGYLADWDAFPRIRIPEGSKRPTDTTSVSLLGLRRAWEETTADVVKRLGPPDREQQTVADTGLKRLRSTVVPFKALRLRAALLLFAVTGARGAEIEALRVGDFHPRYRRYDGSVGPAIAIRPEKTCKGETHMKPIPQAAADMIATLLLYLGKVNGGPLPDDFALLPVDQLHLDVPWSANAIRTRFSGSVPRERTRGVKALLPFDEDVPWLGYTLHPVRSAAAQMIRSDEGKSFMKQHRLRGEPHWIAEALLSHKLAGVPELYGGAAKLPDRERLSGVGTQITWALLATDAGARLTYDADAYRDALRKKAALEAEKHRVRRALDEIEKEDPEGFEQVVRIQRQERRLTRRRDDLSEELSETNLELERLRLDPQRLVAVPNTAPEHGWEVALDEIERQVLGTARADARAARESAVRTWITAGEYQFIGGYRSAATARNHLLGKSLPFRRGDVRNPWEADTIPVDDSTPTRRKILVEGINPEWFDTDEKRERLAVILTTTPEGWSDSVCEAPLRYPDWLKDRLGTK